VIGYAILLSNQHLFWTASTRNNAIDAAFHLHESTHLSGSLGWAAHAGAGRTSKREAILELRGSYPAIWQDYSTIGDRPREGHFRYLLVRVDRSALAGDHVAPDADEVT
jgi:hypothetical protein